MKKYLWLFLLLFSSSSQWVLVEKHWQQQKITDPGFSPKSKISLLSGDMEVKIAAQNIKKMQIVPDVKREINSEFYFGAILELDDGSLWPSDSGSYAFIEVGGELHGRSGKKSLTIPMSSLRGFYVFDKKQTSEEKADE